MSGCQSAEMSLADVCAELARLQADNARIRRKLEAIERKLADAAPDGSKRQGSPAATEFVDMSSNILRNSAQYAMRVTLGVSKEDMKKEVWKLCANIIATQQAWAGVAKAAMASLAAQWGIALEYQQAMHAAISEGTAYALEAKNCGSLTAPFCAVVMMYAAACCEQVNVDRALAKRYMRVLFGVDDAHQSLTMPRKLVVFDTEASPGSKSIVQPAPSCDGDIVRVLHKSMQARAGGGVKLETANTIDKTFVFVNNCGMDKCAFCAETDEEDCFVDVDGMSDDKTQPPRPSPRRRKTSKTKQAKKPAANLGRSSQAGDGGASSQHDRTRRHSSSPRLSSASAAPPLARNEASFSLLAAPKPVEEAAAPSLFPEASPPVPEASPPVPEASPPVPEASPPVPEASPPVPEASLPVPEASPPVPEASPPTPAAPTAAATLQTVPEASPPAPATVSAAPAAALAAALLAPAASPSSLVAASAAPPPATAPAASAPASPAHDPTPANAAPPPPPPQPVFIQAPVNAELMTVRMMQALGLRGMEDHSFSKSSPVSELLSLLASNHESIGANVLVIIGDGAWQSPAVIESLASLFGAGSCEARLPTELAAGLVLGCCLAYQSMIKMSEACGEEGEALLEKYPQHWPGAFATCFSHGFNLNKFGDGKYMRLVTTEAQLVASTPPETRFGDLLMFIKDILAVMHVEEQDCVKAEPSPKKREARVQDQPRSKKRSKA